MREILGMDRSEKGSHLCIWMHAGVVSRRFCNHRYHCLTCRFDRAMYRTAEENKRLQEAGQPLRGARGRIISWKEKLRALPASKRPCIHHMKERILFRSCMNDYRCSKCDFDQYFQDEYVVSAVMRPVDVLNIKGIRVPQGYYFHSGHAWLKLEEGSSVRVGIDDFALRLLGPLDRIEAPLMGKEVKQGRADIAIGRDEQHGRLASPVSGVVTAINHRIRDEGSFASREPYSEGWIMSVHAPDLRRELKGLMIHDETEMFMEKEVSRLYDLIEEVVGPLATDGGYLGDNIYGKIPEVGWSRLTRMFLKT